MVHFSYNFCSSFIFVHLPSSTQPESVGSILALNHKFFNASKSTCETKGSPLWVFFGTMRLFSKIFEIYQRVPPWIFLKFSVCRKRWMSLNGLFLSFSALCDLKNTFFSKKNQNFFFEKNFFFQIFPIVVPWIFLSLRYGADLGRSRLVSFSAYNLTLNGPLFTIFVHLFCCSPSTKFLKPESGGSILALNHNIFMLPKVQQVRPKGPPFGFFSALCDFFRKFLNIIKGYPLHFFEVFGL